MAGFRHHIVESDKNIALAIGSLDVPVLAGLKAGGTVELGAIAPCWACSRDAAPERSSP